MKYNIQTLQRNFLGYLIYLGAGGMGLELALWRDFTPLIWPPSGFGLALLLLLGLRYLPVVFLGSLTVAYFETSLLGNSMIIAGGYTLAALFSFKLLNYYDFRIEMERLKDVVLLVGFAVVLAPLISAYLYIYVMQTNHLVPDIGFRVLFGVRWLSDALGTLALAPFLIVWFSKSRVKWENQNAGEVLVWLATLIFLGAMVFRNWAPTDTLRYPLELTMFPLTAWAGLRYGQKGATLAVLIVALMAVWELRDVISLGATRTITQPPAYLWVFVGVLSITSLFLAAVLSELKVREDIARQNEQRLAGFIRALPDLTFVFTEAGICAEVFAPKGNPLLNHFSTMKGEQLRHIYPNELAIKIEKKIHKAIKSRELEILNYKLMINSESRWFEARFAPVDIAADQVPTVVCFNYDVTQSYLADQELISKDRLLRTLTEAESLLLRENEFEIGLQRSLEIVGKGTVVDWIEIFTIDEGSSHLLERCKSIQRWVRDEEFLKILDDLDLSFLDQINQRWQKDLQDDEYLCLGEKSLSQQIDQRLQIAGVHFMGIFPMFGQNKLNGFVVFGGAGDELLDNKNLHSTLRSIAYGLGGFIESKNIELELFRAKEAAEAADLAKGQFLAMMSHEIRTPMNAIVGFADLLKNTKITSDQEEYVTIIDRSGKELIELISHILDYSKLESNQVKLEETAFVLETTVVESLEMVLMKARDKGINIDYHINDTSSGIYIGDPLRLRQVLVNLLSNAVKFTHKGSVELLVNSEETVSGLRKLTLQVVDTGVGIPEDKITDLFKPFEQLDSSTTREYGGTGLGLTIVDQIVRRMDGHINVTSELGRGTCVQVEIQLMNEFNLVKSRIGKANSSFDSGLAERVPMEVLVVGRDPRSSALIMEDFKRLGYLSVKLICELDEAVMVYQNTSFGLIFIDESAEGNLHEEMIERVRFNGGGDSEKVTWVVAQNDTSVSLSDLQGRYPEVHDCLLKPVKLEDLKALILRLEERNV